MKIIRIFLLLVLILGMPSCNIEPKESSSQNDNKPAIIPLLDLSQANRLANLPIACIEQEYPNKLGQVIGSADDLKSPAELHPAFYGCFDWHSSVHGHWSLVRLLKEFPDLESADTIRIMLSKRISPENISKEVEYFKGEHNATYERTYGWAWLLKLAEELETWDDPLGKELATNLKPLTNLIVNMYIEFLPKLQYPIREGTHSNTAFGLSFAYDYARTSGNEALGKPFQKEPETFT